MVLDDLLGLIPGKCITRIGRLFFLKGEENYQLTLSKNMVTISAINDRGDFIPNKYSLENKTYVDLPLSIEDRTNLLVALRKK